MSWSLAPRLARHNIHYAWLVIAVTFLTMLVTAGAMGAPGVLIVPLEKEFGWSDGQISAALALRILLFGLMAPFTAAFLNRFGLRPVIVAALGLIVAGFLASLTMSHYWQLIALWGVVLGFGTGLTAMVLAATVATRWFTARRGLAMGLLSASNATGQLVFLPAIAALSEHLGWRAALLAVCAVLVVAALVVVLLMRNYPADVGLPPYGEAAVVPPPAHASGLATLLTTPILTLKEAARVPVFWVLFATFFVCGASTNGLVQTHFVTLCADYGIAAVGAASLLAVIGVFDLFGTIGSGWLSDRVDNRWLLFMYYGLRGLSLLYLPFTTFTLYGLSLFAVFYGLDWVATVPPTVKLTAERFGRDKAGLVFGWIFCGHQLGAATAALGAGVTRTTLNTYLPAFFASGLLCLVAALLALTLARPRPQPALATA
jgi:sugar phosphate permease